MIFDSFDWMQGEPELIGVDNYPLYASDPYYQQQIYLNDALKESSLPEFWWQNLKASITLDGLITENQDEFDVQAWVKLSKIRIKIISEKDFFVFTTILACCTRILWIEHSRLDRNEHRINQDQYIQELNDLDLSSMTTTISNEKIVEITEFFIKGESHHKISHTKYFEVLYGILDDFLYEILQLSDAEVVELIELYTKGLFLLSSDCQPSSEHRKKLISSKIINLIKKANPLSQELRLALEQLKDAAIIRYNRDTYKKWITFLEKTLQKFEIQRGDVWSDRLLLDLEALDTESKKSWQNLILHAATADKSQPSSKWDKKTKELVGEIGEESFINYCLECFPLVAKPREGYHDTFPYAVRFASSNEDAALVMYEKNCLLLKGLVWCCSTLIDIRLIPALGALAEACYKKIPQIGARSQSVGNACIYALSMIPIQEAVTQLERLQTKIKYSQAKRLIQKAFETAAARQGITKEDLLELSVPKYGLNENGTFQQSFGAFTAEVTIQSSTQVTLQWYKPDGKLQKTLPSEVKNNHASELKELKRNISEIESLLKVHRDRIENTYLQPRTWKYTDWQERLATHPLLGYLVNRLVWEFSNDKHQETGIWYQNQVVNTQGQPLTWLATEEAIVRLWHPIFADISMVSSWRDWLETHQIRQPFKQAYREIYLLTEAEQNTRTYSNRFAAHILRQHQMTQLMKQRGWEYNLQGGFDGANNAIFHLPQGNLSAEFYVEPAGEELSPAYIYLYVASDRVCFYRDRQTQIPLAEIPALAFSEVMRNVDLFVGVASIGNDPNWSDRGENAYNTYWGDYCFGELAMSAQLRREVITRLLPKLKIRDRCKIDDRFLIVEGKKRTYKIHFGSGNILMEPNNSYLCIVADSLKTSQGSEVFLPFEGDGMLSIILSKAFLLAEDDKIKDRSIISQIER
jgi:Domain of unknown function (DUF4132)